MDSWFRLLQAGAAGDRATCVEWSAKLGYLTGEENEVRTTFFMKHRSIFTFGFSDNARRTHSIHDSPGSALQDVHTPTSRFRARNRVGSHDGGNQRAYSCHAQKSAYASPERDV